MDGGDGRRSRCGWSDGGGTVEVETMEGGGRMEVETMEVDTMEVDTVEV